MKIIAHRGNLHGPTPELENDPRYIDTALNALVDVEVDLWYIDKKLYLGHDEPKYSIDKLWIEHRKDKLWIHVKNIECMDYMSTKNFNYFWHEKDKITLTSNGTPWCYPGVYIKTGITVILDKYEKSIDVFGICTDHAIYMKEKTQ